MQQAPAQQPTNLQPAHRLAAAVSHACIHAVWVTPRGLSHNNIDIAKQPFIS
jgi:hypothetical protein